MFSLGMTSKTHGGFPKGAIAPSEPPRLHPFVRRAIIGPCLVVATLLFCSALRAQNHDTLMLVRDWNPDTGMLSGWLPMHRISMTLQFIGVKGAARFGFNEVVKIIWTKREDDSPGRSGDVRISPAYRMFDGKKWLPLDRDANVVRIKSSLYLIRDITFEGSPPTESDKERFEKCAEGQKSGKALSAACDGPPKG